MSLVRLMHRLEVNRAVLYAVLLRAWQLGAGAVSVVLIGFFLDPAAQGFYYTFASLIALRALVELGLTTAVINVASHEWAHLRLDKRGNLQGDPAARSRLASLGRLLLWWYGAAAVLFALAVGLGGWLFLSYHDSPSVAWQRPWVALVVVSGLLLWTLPFGELLVGCGQVANVNRFRLLQAVAANLAVWTGLCLGAGLWIAVAAAGARLVVELCLLGWRYRRFFQCLIRSPVGAKISWRDELWPLQWRLALAAVSGYFALSLFTPIMFHYHGPAVAGQMGMTWTIVLALQGAAAAWVYARVPRFGVLIAHGEYAELDLLFRRLVIVSLAVLTAGALAAWCVVVLLNVSGIWLADRLLAPLPLAVFLLGTVPSHVAESQELYIRAHKRDPVLPVCVSGNVITGLLVWLLGSTRLGPLGAAIAYTATAFLVVLPGMTFLWHRSRRVWHK